MQADPATGDTSEFPVAGAVFDQPVRVIVVNIWVIVLQGRSPLIKLLKYKLKWEFPVLPRFLEGRRSVPRRANLQFLEGRRSVPRGANCAE